MPTLVLALLDPERPVTLGARARAVAIAALALLAILVAVDRQRIVDERNAVASRLPALGVPPLDEPAFRRRLTRDEGTAFATLAVARELLDRGLESVHGAEEEPAGKASSDPLVEAEALANEALGRQPASAEAAMIVGAARALTRLRDRDPRYFSHWRDWERPLVLATERAPHASAPRRYLAAAYLETWPALSAEKRPEVAALLREAFEDERLFALLVDRWIELAGSLDAAAELLPQRAATWQLLSERALRGEKFPLALRFRERARTARAVEQSAALDRALAALEASGDALSARREIGDLIAGLALEGGSVALLERALARLPPGPAARPLSTVARAWIDWAVPLCLLRDCPLAPATLARLGSLAGAELPSELDAVVALAAGETARADRLALRGQALWSDAWAPFSTLAAKRALDRGATDEAAARLAPLGRAAAPTLALRIVAERLGRGDLAHGPVAAETWQPTAWRDGQRTLELLPSRAAAALVVELHRPAERRSILLVERNGAASTPLVIEPGATSWRVAGPIDAAPQRIRVTTLAGELPPPGVTRLAS